MGKKKELTKWQRWTLVISVAALILSAFGLILGRRSNFQFIPDDNTISFPTHPTTPTDDNGETPTDPVYEAPVILRNSPEINVGVETAAFTIYVTNSEHVITMGTEYTVDGIDELSYDSMVEATDYLGRWFVIKDKSSFSTYISDDTVIDIHVTMVYYKEDGSYDDVTESDVLSFTYLLEDQDPEYYPPEVLKSTFDYEVDIPTTTIEFGFSTTYHELINKITCYFVIDDDIVEIPIGSDYTYDVDHIGEGRYESSIDYSVFEEDIDVFIYLQVNYVNETGGDDFFIFEELAEFQNPSGTANGIGFNYIYAIIAAMVALTIFTIIKKIKTKKVIN